MSFCSTWMCDRLQPDPQPVHHHSKQTETNSSFVSLAASSPLPIVNVSMRLIAVSNLYFGFWPRKLAFSNLLLLMIKIAVSFAINPSAFPFCSICPDMSDMGVRFIEPEALVCLLSCLCSYMNLITARSLHRSIICPSLLSVSKSRCRLLSPEQEEKEEVDRRHSSLNDWNFTTTTIDHQKNPYSCHLIVARITIPPTIATATTAVVSRSRRQARGGVYHRAGRIAA